ncbi:hypothetical protein HYW83_04265 [Candidatus Peregrinibacteria bacterium]|nr:hypothetical protein [Candidatus Peregrinibacteria bacterium]
MDQPEIEAVDVVPYELRRFQPFTVTLFSKSERTKYVEDKKDRTLARELTGAPWRPIIAINKAYRIRLSIFLHSGGGEAVRLSEWECFLDRLNKADIETNIYVPVAALSAGARVLMKCARRYVTPSTNIYFHSSGCRFSTVEEAQRQLAAMRGRDKLKLVGGRERVYLLCEDDIRFNRAQITSLAQGQSDAHARLRKRVDQVFADPSLPRDDLWVNGQELHELGEVDLVRDITAMKALFISNVGPEAQGKWDELETMIRQHP